MDLTSLQNRLKSAIRDVPDFPKPGILFRDITTIISNAEVFDELMTFLESRYKSYGLDFIVGIESRGFIFGAALASRLKIGFVPIRKKGKLPCQTYQESYDLEYGTDTLEIHADAFVPFAQNSTKSSSSNKIDSPLILLVDDLLATGGTANASINLVQKAGGKVLESCFLIALKSEFSPTLKSPSFALLEL